MTPFLQRFSATGYICAHRGARSIAPENTLLALEKARQCGADLWETDVQATADGELILFHDRTLGRTTDVAGHDEFRGRRSRPVSEFRLTELRSLDAGTWFLRADPFATVAAGEVLQAEYPAIRTQRIPLLLDALNYCRQHDFPMNLEIKDQSGTAADNIIVRGILDLLAETGTEQLVLLSSFNHDYLRQVKQRNPDIATAALVEKRHPDNLVEYLRDLRVEAYHPDQRISDARLVKQLTESGMQVNLWTVNDPAQAQYYIAAGATFICTDWPQRLIGACHSP